MFRFARTHPLATALSGLALLSGLAWLAFGFFGVHLLFVDERVSEAPPVFAAPAITVPATAPTPAPTASPTTVPVPVPAPTTVPTTVPTIVPVPTTVPTTAAPTVVTEYAADFRSINHSTSGRAIVLGNGTGQRFLRFEDFETDNGPDLNVYLVNSGTGDVSDFVDLGDLAGNIGEQNYEIPAGVDLDVYDRVLVWCVRFSSAFGDAALEPVA